MCYVCSEEDDWFIEYSWSHGGEEDGVDSAQLDIDLQTEIGECLGGRLDHILRLHTLSRYPQHCVAHSLHLS